MTNFEYYTQNEYKLASLLEPDTCCEGEICCPVWDDNECDSVENCFKNIVAWLQQRKELYND
jgi:hypothetical protein